MENKFLVLIVMVFICGFLSAWEIEDVNGTYVDEEAYLKINRTVREPFSWGWGLQIVDTTIEFDLGEDIIRMPRLGKYFIDTVYKDEQGSICLTTFYMGDKTREDPMTIKVTFIDRNKVYIVCDHWERWSARNYSPEAKWVWYRLS